jgi:putative DNA primase/helicase
MTIMNNDVTLAAIEYLKLGFSVIPIQPKGKKPEASVLPRDVDNKARWEVYTLRPPLPDEARQWFENRPSLNIGIVTGRVSGIVVVDLDGQEGTESFKKLVSGTRNPTCWVVTGNGYHGYFKYPSNSTIGNRVGVLPGVDIRSDGGYVVAPPSVHISGKVYDWNRRFPHRGVLAELPSVLLSKLTEQKASVGPSPALKAQATGQHAEIATRIFEHQCACLQSAPTSSRNNQLNLSTYTLARIAQTGALSESVVRDAMRSIALSIGLGEREIERTIDSAFKAGSSPARIWKWHR